MYIKSRSSFQPWQEVFPKQQEGTWGCRSALLPAGLAEGQQEQGQPRTAMTASGITGYYPELRFIRSLHAVLSLKSCLVPEIILLLKIITLFQAFKTFSQKSQNETKPLRKSILLQSHLFNKQSLLLESRQYRVIFTKPLISAKLLSHSG